VKMFLSCGAGWNPAAGCQPARSAGKQPARSLPSCPTKGHSLTVADLVLENVSFLVVHAEIQAVAFLLPGYPQSDRGVDNLEDRERAHDGQAPGNGGGPKLVEDLAAVAVHQAERLYFAGSVLQSLVNRAGGEDAGEQRAQGAAGAVHAEGIQRVVVTELALDARD